MTSLALWGADGPVARASALLGRPYEPRAEQQQMAHVITQALERQETQDVGIVPIEAGTGVGKTLAYLIPGALHAAAAGRSMLVSTHTIALGTQILTQDGPLVQAVVEDVLGTRPSIAHLRGRRHFVSASRAQAVGNLLRDDGLPRSAWQPYLDVAQEASRAAVMAVAALEAQDFGEATQRLVQSALMERVEEVHGFEFDKSEICLLSNSPEAELAVHKLSRALAISATILVTTHAYTVIALTRRALFDTATTPFDSLMIDEADQWSNAAASVSMASVSLTTLRHSIEAVLGASRHDGGKGEVSRVAIAMLDLIDQLTEQAPKEPNRTKPLTSTDTAGTLLWDVLAQAAQLLKHAREQRSHTAAADALQEVMGDLRRLVLAMMEDETSYWTVRWKTSRVNAAPSIEMVGAAPGRIMQRLWRPAAGANDHTPLARTVVLTSATLTIPGFSEQSRWAGIGAATGITSASNLLLSDLACVIQPTDFGRLRVRFADPRAPVPNVDETGSTSSESRAYIVQVIRAAMNASDKVKGRTLVLVPSYDDVRWFAPMLPDALPHIHGVAMDKMVDVYRATPGCCLITPGAWNGIDLPRMVQNLVIPRVPFPPRDNTESHAFIQGLSQALGKLAQGIGRAIRCRSDDATLWFADPRIPIPEAVTERTGLLPHPRANPMLLASIPARFREAFDFDEEAADIAVPYVQAKPVFDGRMERKAKGATKPARAAGKGRS